MSKYLDDDELYARLRAGEYQLLDQVYDQHRDKFVTFAQRNLYSTEDDAVDSFQDAVISFYKNLVRGSYEKRTDASIGTYVISIAKRNVYRRNEKARREVATDHEDGIGLEDDLDLSVINHFEDEDRRKRLQAGMSRLGKKCQNLLTLSFYHRYPTESIMDTLGYSTPGAVRIAKMRCLNKLRDLLKL